MHARARGSNIPPRRLVNFQEPYQKAEQDEQEEETEEGEEEGFKEKSLEGYF